MDKEEGGEGGEGGGETNLGTAVLELAWGDGGSSACSDCGIPCEWRCLVAGTVLVVSVEDSLLLLGQDSSLLWLLHGISPSEDGVVRAREGDVVGEGDGVGRKQDLGVGGDQDGGCSEEEGSEFDHGW